MLINILNTKQNKLSDELISQYLIIPIDEIKEIISTALRDTDFRFKIDNMNYTIIDTTQIDALWQLQLAYKNEIGEDAPSNDARERLFAAMKSGIIGFYGVFDMDRLVACCSVTKGFSTFNYAPSGVFEDFYIIPEYRHRGIARKLVKFAFE